MTRGGIVGVVVGVVAVAAAAVVAVMYLPQDGGGGGSAVTGGPADAGGPGGAPGGATPVTPVKAVHARTVARDVPGDALAFAVLGAPAGLLEFATAFVPADVRTTLLANAPFDLFSAAAWKELGIDLGAPLGAAFLDARAESFLLSVGASDPARAPEQVRAALAKLGVPEPLEEKAFGESKAFFFGDEAALLCTRSRIVLVAGDRFRRMPGVSDDRAGLEQVVARIAGLTESASLAADPLFTETMDALGATDVSGYVNTAAVRALVTGDDAEEVAARTALGEVKAIGAGVALTTGRLAIRVHAPLPDGARLAKVFAGRARAVDTFDRISGPALTGLQVNLDPVAVWEAVESYVRMDRYALRDWEQGQQAIREELALRVFEDVVQTLTGDIGLVLARLPPASNPLAFDLVVFAAVKDTKVADALVGALYRRIPAGGDVAAPGREAVGDGALYPITGPGFRAAAGVGNGRIWFAMNERQVRAILDGSAKPLWDDPRAENVAAALRGAEAVVAFADLRAFFDQLAPFIPRREQEAYQMAAPALRALDGVTVKAGVTGSAFDLSGTVLYDDATARTAAQAALATTAGAAFTKYQARAKSTEAIDMLDRIYKGAAVYYTTPKVDQTGVKLPCQFPPSIACTPEGSPCDHPGKRYPSTAEVWNVPTWSALYFQVTDAHFFRYCFESSGTLGDAQFTATAHADLDCDGVWSTFQRMGYGEVDAGTGECSMKGSSAFYVEQETE